MPDEITKRRFAELAGSIARLLTELKLASHVLNNDGAQLHHALEQFLTQLERVKADPSQIAALRVQLNTTWEVFQDEAMARVEAAVDALDSLSVELGQITENLPTLPPPKGERKGSDKGKRTKKRKK